MNGSESILQSNIDEETPEVWQTWLYGTLIISITSISSPLGIIMVPLLSKSLYDRCMTFLVALGIGAMSGSCLFILLPHSFNITEVTSIDYLQKCWLIVGALYGFFAIDRMLQCLLELRRRRQSKARIHAATLHQMFPKKESHLTNGNDLEMQKDIDKIKDEIDVSMLSNTLARTFSTRRTVAVLKPDDRIQYRNSNGRTLETDEQSLASMSRSPTAQPTPAASPLASPHLQRHHTDRYSLPPKKDTFPIPHRDYLPPPKEDDNVSVTVAVHEKKVINKKDIEVASVAYMIIFGSAANNFVDGMSIGAAFADNIIRGVGIGMAVVSQQFPQELGTLAILINSGLGLKKTLLFQIIPIGLSYLGFAAGILLDNLDDSYDSFIFSISAGMYLYIFLGTLLPEIRESFNELLKNDLGEALLTTILQFSGILFGTTFMFVMNITNDEI